MKNCKKVLKEARKKILEESVLGRWKEQFEEMMNEENEREEDRWWNKKCKEEVRAAMQMMKSGNVVGSEYMYYFQKGEK